MREGSLIMAAKAQLLAILASSLGLAAFVGCTSLTQTDEQRGQIIVKPFGKAPDGSEVNLYTLRNRKGAEVGVCNYGGLVIFLRVPDRDGKFGDVVLGYDDLPGYVKDSPYFG